jgi:hypothetical protein
MKAVKSLFINGQVNAAHCGARFAAVRHGLSTPRPGASFNGGNGRANAISDELLAISVNSITVMPAKARIHCAAQWTPAFAGVTWRD